jgi:hypothetical protein
MSTPEPNRGAQEANARMTFRESAAALVVVGGGVILLSTVIDPDTSPTAVLVGLICFFGGVILVWLARRGST